MNKKYFVTAETDRGYDNCDIGEYTNLKEAIKDTKHWWYGLCEIDKKKYLIEKTEIFIYKDVDGVTDCVWSKPVADYK